MIRAVAALLVLALLPAALTAQVDTTKRTRPARDSTARDSTARDSTARDSTARDTTPLLLPVFPQAIVQGPLPKGTRYTFTADSLLLLTSRTLSDLLLHIPGVYVARGGWFGQAEPVLYGGRGAAGLEIYWDGVPYRPLGRDSVYLDPARIPLAAIERVDVIILPATLRVYLVSTGHRSTAARTQIGILTGQQDIADYRAGYAARTRSGVGVSLIADWNSIGPGALSNTSTSFGASDIWLKADYVPADGRLGASFEVLSSSWHRSQGDRVDGWRQDRHDRLLRMFVAQRNDGTGWRLTGSLSTTELSRDTATRARAISVAQLDASQVWRRAAVVATARFGAGGAPQQLEANVGWMPLEPLVLSGSVRQSSYSGGRTGAQAFGTAGLTLPFGFSARAEAAWRRDPQSALLATTLVTQQTDVAAWLRFDHRRLSVEVGRGRRDPFEPFGFAQGISAVDSLSPTPLTDFVAARASIHVSPGFQVSGWYFDPIAGGGDFEPPHHARVSATFYSKFWRVFSSGIFALRAEVAMESWSRWALGGIDATGTKRAMTGSSFVDTNLEMQLAGVTIFWTVQNINVMRSSYVNGLGFPKAYQSYGARWFFTN
ncbi:MAG TPA: TonB-dependent receptor plug domain-containing protein [Gemmatimonadales bacterium]